MRQLEDRVGGRQSDTGNDRTQIVECIARFLTLGLLACAGDRIEALQEQLPDLLITEGRNQIAHRFRGQRIRQFDRSHLLRDFRTGRRGQTHLRVSWLNCRGNHQQ